MNESRSELDTVGELAESFLARYRRGERPSLREYTDRHPALAEQIRELFSALAALEELGSVEGPPDDGGTGAGQTEAPRRLGEYRIIREVARGGMGIVYEAMQESLGRHVALKVLPAHGLWSPTHLERFRREARAAAQLHHTNIVPVFGVGEHAGVHYYAMQFIQGQSLDLVLHELQRLRGSEASRSEAPAQAPVPAEERPGGSDLSCSVAQSLLTGPSKGDDAVAAQAGGRAVTGAAATDSQAGLTSQSEAQYFQSVARVGVQVADALAYAHHQGILHRDIKPPNLLLDTQGTVWVTDFGLAKTEGTDELTHPGDIVGTLRYMAPERFSNQADPRSDVYGLGLTLYEMLTLRPAFKADERSRLIERVLHEEPPSPRKLDARIPRDLETIVLKSIAKDPRDRYATATALAGDLRRFLAGQPIYARPIGPWERAVKWARRRPAAAGLVGVSGLASVLLVAGLVVGFLLEKRAREEIDLAYHREQQISYLGGIGSAFHEISARNWGGAEELLEGCPERLRGWEWHYLKRLCHIPPISPLPVGERINMISGFDLAFDPNSPLLAIPSNDNSIRIWDASNGRKVLTLNGHMDRVLSLAFSPDGRRLASTSEDKTVKVWDLMAGLENGELRKPLFTCAHEEPVIGVAFSLDGKRLASTSGDTEKPGQVKIWDAASGELLFKPFPGQARPDPLVHLAFSPDGGRLASGSVDNSVKVWDLTTGDEVYTLPGHTDLVINVTFTPDGRRLISASRGREVKVWDLPPGEPGVATPEGRVLAPRWTLPDLSNSVWAMALSADGSRLAIGGPTADGNVRVYEMTSGRLLHTLRGDIRLISVAFSPDGRRLAAAGHERIVRLWDTATGHEVLSLRGHKDIIGRVLFSPDGQRLASASADGEVQIWDGSPLDQTDPRVRTLGGHDGEFFGLAFSPDGRWLASASTDKSIKLWDVQSGQVVRAFHGHQEAAMCVAFSPDGRRLVSGSMDRTAKLWDAQTGKELLSIPGFKVMVYSVAFSPDGRAFATGSHRKLQLWDTQTGHLLLDRQADPEFVSRVAFSPNGKYLATTGHGGTAKVWNVTSGEEICAFTKHQTSVFGLAFHPQGKYLVSGGYDRRVRLWDRASGDEINTLSEHTASVSSVAFSPDGRYLATASGKEVIVWDVTDLKNIERLKIFDRLPGRTSGVAFNPDGKHLAAASGYKGKGEIKIWDTSLWDNQASGRRKPPEGRDR